jgi:hypothetical protein
MMLARELKKRANKSSRRLLELVENVLEVQPPQRNRRLAARPFFERDEE